MYDVTRPESLHALERWWSEFRDRAPVPDEELVARLLKRAEIEGRADDTEDVIQHRLDLYHEQTAAVIESYAQRGIVASVDGTCQIDDVTERLLQAVYGVRERTGSLKVVNPDAPQA